MSYLISVIVPTYNRSDSVERLLKVLGKQTLAKTEYEVIISIDGSEDGTLELVNNFKAPYELISLWQPNQGRAAACNLGLEVAEGELVVILDDDMEPEPGLLEAHYKSHLNDKRLGVMGAVPVLIDQTTTPVVEFIGTKFNAHLEKLAEPGHQLKLRDFYSGNFSIRREVLQEVGGYDPAFKIYGNEDLELSLRLEKAGVRLVYNPQAKARQHYTKSFKGLARDNIAKGRTAVLLASKHTGTYSDLKLAAYKQASRKWRLVRASLLGVTRLWSKTPDVVTKIVIWLEKRHPARMEMYYNFALDYFFWVGARAAMRERKKETVFKPAILRTVKFW